MNSSVADASRSRFAAPVEGTSIQRASREIVFAAVVAALTAGIVAAALRFGQRSFFVWPDAREQTWAWWQKLAQAWSAGYLPLWDANTFGGHSFVGEFQAGVFYPPAWAWLALFATPDGIATPALEAFVVLHFALCAAGMALLLRHWRLSRVACVFGALGFALIGAVAQRAAAQPNIFFGLCLLPWAVLAASAYCRSRKLVFAFATGAVVALQLLAGHVQPALHTALIVAAMLLFHHRRGGTPWRSALLRTVRSGVPIALSLLVVSAPQWILSLQYLHDAYRWVSADAPIGPGQFVPYAVYAYKHIIGPADLPSLIDPWRFRVDDSNTLYVGATTLALALAFAAARATRQSLTAWSENRDWLVATGAFAAVAMFGHWTLLAIVLRIVPIVGQVRELGRYVVLLQFAACVIGAFAVHALNTQAFPDVGRAKRHWIAAWFVAVAIAALLRTADLVSMPAWLALCAPIAIAGLYLLGMPQRWLAHACTTAAVLTALACVNLAIPLGAGNTPVDQAFAINAITARLQGSYGRERVLVDDSAGLPKNYADAKRLQTTLGHAATMYRPYFDFLARDWRVDGEINDLLGVRWIVSKKDLDFPLIASDAATGLRLYERPGSYSRIFRLDQYGAAPAGRRIDYDVIAYDDEVQHFRLRVERATTAVVGEVAYPGWCARVNGRPVPISRAVLGGAVTPLRAIALDAGENDVEFSYRPFRSLILGCDR
jgi:hypothetical protein